MINPIKKNSLERKVGKKPKMGFFKKAMVYTLLVTAGLYLVSRVINGIKPNFGDYNPRPSNLEQIMGTPCAVIGGGCGNGNQETLQDERVGGNAEDDESGGDNDSSSIPPIDDEGDNFIPDFSCPEGMIAIPGGKINVVYFGEKWGGGKHIKQEEINPFCIDQYEASQPDATSDYRGSWVSGWGIPLATSRLGVLPWSEISQEDAQIACYNSDKRLPTIAEWQMAFSGMGGDNWPWGTSWEEKNCYANLSEDSPILNPTGGCCFDLFGTGEICDMVGNVSEWTSSLWDYDCYGDTQVMIAGGAGRSSTSSENIQIEDPEHPGCMRWAQYGLPRYSLHHHLYDQGVPSDDGFRCVADPIHYE